MKIDIDSLKDSFKFGYEAYEESREEADIVENMFHNRQYTAEQINTLQSRGQPVETFNVIKMFTRLLLGYYSTVVNTVRVQPRNIRDILTASLLNDVVNFTLEDNQFETEGDKVKQDGILTGLLCVQEKIVDTGKKDQFGRPQYRIDITHVPPSEIVIDPLSRKEDYSDGRFIHRFKWVSEDAIKKMFPSKKGLIDRLDAYNNHLSQTDTEFEKYFSHKFLGNFAQFNCYLLVNSIVEDDKGTVWSIWWCGDEIIYKKEVTYREVKFTYRVHKTNRSNRTEYYGLFREIIEPQKAINQALTKIQLMVNTQKAFVEKGAVDNINTFTDQFNRVNAVIPVKNLAGIRIEHLAREVLDQYTVIDKALDRIQRVLGINDSFLGMAYASDSGRKVKLQQNATIISLRHLTARIQQFYRLLGIDITNLVKQYYTSNQVLRITDEATGFRWAEINKPMQQWTGRFDASGQPEMEYVYEEVLDPASGEPMEDEYGNIIIAPVPEQETEIAFSDVDIKIDSVAYNDEDEKNQLFMETFLQGPVGQSLLQVNPGAYFKASSLAIRSLKTRHSLEISQLLEQTAAMLTPEQEMMLQQGNGGNQDQARSQQLKLPQNTNEGL